MGIAEEESAELRERRRKRKDSLAISWQTYVQVQISNYEAVPAKSPS